MLVGLTISENISITSALSVNPLICASFISCFPPLLLLTTPHYAFDSPSFASSGTSCAHSATHFHIFCMFLVFTSKKRSIQSKTIFSLLIFPPVKVFGTITLLLKGFETSFFSSFLIYLSCFSCQILSFWTFVGFILLFCHLLSYIG